MKSSTQRLHEAIVAHSPSRVRESLALGADPNKPSTDGLTALERAIDETYDDGPIESVQLLLEHGADLGRPKYSEILLLAWQPTNKELARLLLEAGANGEVCTETGDSPLRDSVAEGDLEFVALLLRSGANKSIDKWGGENTNCLTPLGIAAQRLDLPMMELLLEAGANPQAPGDGLLRAEDHLPPRSASNSARWDRAKRLLSGHS